MKLGYFGFNLGALNNPDSMERVVVAAEQLGYESVWTGEHIVLMDPHEAPSPVPPESNFVDTIASLAFASHHLVVLSEYFPPGWTALLGACVAVGGGVWCLMYERQRTLTGAWISHVVVDLAILWVGYRLLF